MTTGIVTLLLTNVASVVASHHTSVEESDGLPLFDVKRPSVVPPVQDFRPGSPVSRPRIRSTKLAEGQPVWVLLAYTLLPWLFNSNQPLTKPELLTVIMAIVSSFVGWHVLRGFCSGGNNFGLTTKQHAMTSFIATATAGAGLLMLFQIVAAAATGTHGGHFILVIIRVVGNAYSYVFNPPPDARIVDYFTNMLISVGTCEEVTKLLPVALLLRRGKARSLPIRDFMFVGAMSGLGFGVAEGLWYSRTEYIPGGSLFGTYVIRFASCAIMHGVWTVMATVILFHVRGVVKEIGGGGFFVDWIVLLLALAVICLPPAICHSLYNTLVTLDVPLFPTAVDAVAVLGVASLRVPTNLKNESTTVGHSRLASTRRQRAQPVWPWVLLGSGLTLVGLCGLGALFVEDTQPNSRMPQQSVGTEPADAFEQLALAFKRQLPATLSPTESFNDVTYDVQRRNSVVLPYEGIIHFALSVGYETVPVGNGLEDMPLKHSLVVDVSVSYVYDVKTNRWQFQRVILRGREIKADEVLLLMADMMGVGQTVRERLEAKRRSFGGEYTRGSEMERAAQESQFLNLCLNIPSVLE